MTTYVYMRSEPGLYTVGHYSPDGRWQPESDHASTEKAARRVATLNGHDSELRAENERLRAGLTRIVRFIDNAGNRPPAMTDMDVIHNIHWLASDALAVQP